MGIVEGTEVVATSAGLGLVLPIVGRGQTPDLETIISVLRALDAPGRCALVEVWTVGPLGLEARPSALDRAVEEWDGRCRVVRAHRECAGPSWNDAARAGLAAVSGDVAAVLDLERGHAPAAVAAVVGTLLDDERLELAVAVAAPGGPRGPGRWLRAGVGRAVRALFGSAGAGSGLFAARRSLWEREGPSVPNGDGRGLVLEMLARKPLRTRDVPTAPGPRSGGRPRRLGPRDARALKFLIDARFGNLSRLVQFCAVGASGAMVDLSLYALFQWLLGRTGLVPAESTVWGVSPLLAVAGAGSIAIALLWNFTLNRRLTFNDARRGRWAPQFVTYALSNALAIALNFSVRLYLPTRLGFFGRHRLAAALVGIVAATGISFSMARWVVFTRPGDADAGSTAGPDESDGADTSAAARSDRASAVV